MTPVSINQSLLNLNDAFEQLNQSWQADPCAIDDLQLIKQKNYYDFFKKYKDFNFEEIILEIINLKIDPVILNGIRSYFRDNLKVYKKNKNKFEKFNTYQLFEFSERKFFDNKLEVLYRDKSDVEKFEYRFPEEQQKLLKDIDDAIERLKSEKSGYIHSGRWVLRNYYKEIHKLTLKLSSTFESYFPETQKEITKFGQPTPNPVSPINLQEEKIYVNMRLSSDIHELCNDQQFNTISEPEFYHLLNNLPGKSKLIIKPGEKSRVYYLLHRILEKLPVAEKKKWRNYIFTLLNINESQYKSKYREPISQMPSKKSKQFAKKLQEIFDNH